MWQYRELIAILTITDLKNKYQNTSLGFFWSILSPFLFAGILYVVFRGLFGQEKDYVSNLLVGIMAWRFFTIGTSTALQTFVSRASLITKVYIPREALVLSSTISSLVSAFFEFLILLPIILILRGSLPPTVPLFVFIHLLFFVIIYGTGLFLASVYVYFRDAAQIWEVLLNMLMFCSPIFYPLSIVPAYLINYYMLNPVTLVITMYRSVIVAGVPPSAATVITASTLAVIAVVVGTFAFSRLQRRFAEAI